MRRPSRILLAIAALAGLPAVEIFLPGPRGTELWEAAYDAGHAPLFGLFSIAALAVLGATRPPRRRTAAYLAAFAAALVVGIALEIMQIPGPRTAELSDVVRNMTGSSAFLLFAATFDRELTLPWSSRKWPLRALAVVLVAAVFVPVALAGAATAERVAAFPNLCDFDSLLARQQFYTTESATVEIVAPPPGWPREPGDRVARVTFRSGPEPWSLLGLRDPLPDWSAYERLTLTLYSLLPAPVKLTLKIEDAPEGRVWSDRYNGKLTVGPGINAITVPLAEVRRAPRGREMDLTRINKVQIFTSRPDRSFCLYLDDLRLE